MKRLILASQSPRRKELLEKCGYSFICIPADVDEIIDESKPLEKEIERLALKKAETILTMYPDAIVIGSDTIVVLDNKILGKPKNHVEARRMLNSLSNKKHSVITGLCIISNQKKYITSTTSHVSFAKMSEEEIDAYIATGECDDKAGAYAIQGYGARYIQGIEGDYYSIMGLPLHLVYEELKNMYAY
ncbi:MAG: septum formation protein Maf [Solobacterium sp.]|nr:septum formation protein Maf [Solobacterium sp.]